MSTKSLIVSCAAAAALGTFCAGAAFAGSLPKPTVGGKLYFDLTHIDMQSNGQKTAESGTGIDVKRFYLTFDEKFDRMWSAKVVTDATYNKNQQTDVYIKNAFIQATLNKAFWVRLGDANLPWVPFDEGVYGYRYVENTLIDRLHFGTSADWGLHVGGRFEGGKVSYRLSAVNGNGYKNPSRSKTMDIEGRLTVRPIDGVILAIGGYTGKLGKDVYGVTTYHTASRFDALAAYVKSGLRVGVEYFTANDWNNVTTPASNKADGYSAWASYDLTPMWSVFGRYDGAKTSKELDPNLKDEYFNVGVAMHPRKDVDLALVFKHETVTGGGFVNTTNGKIGGTLNGKYDEIGVWGQVAF